MPPWLRWVESGDSRLSVASAKEIATLRVDRGTSARRGLSAARRPVIVRQVEHRAAGLVVKMTQPVYSARV